MAELSTRIVSDNVRWERLYYHNEVQVLCDEMFQIFVMIQTTFVLCRQTLKIDSVVKTVAIGLLTEISNKTHKNNKYNKI